MSDFTGRVVKMSTSERDRIDPDWGFVRSGWYWCIEFNGRIGLSAEEISDKYKNEIDSEVLQSAVLIIEWVKQILENERIKNGNSSRAK